MGWNGVVLEVVSWCSRLTGSGKKMTCIQQGIQQGIQHLELCQMHRRLHHGDSRECTCSPRRASAFQPRPTCRQAGHPRFQPSSPLQPPPLPQHRTLVTVWQIPFPLDSSLGSSSDVGEAVLVSTGPDGERTAAVVVASRLLGPRRMGDRSGEVVRRPEPPSLAPCVSSGPEWE